jgi:hypothetical protein
MTIILTTLALITITLAVLLIGLYLNRAVWKQRYFFTAARLAETQRELEGSRAVGRAALGVLNKESEWPEILER